MKYKGIRVVGTVVMLLFVCVQSAIILWNYGRTGMGVNDPFQDLGKFSWSIIVGNDWLGWALCTLCFFSCYSMDSVSCCDGKTSVSTNYFVWKTRILSCILYCL